ncbi:MAG: amidohydrolase family protein [Pirellulaceae bacterium]|nr:amidohydrolase family protein [Pirellulaceae bacterium]
MAIEHLRHTSLQLTRREFTAMGATALATTALAVGLTGSANAAMLEDNWIDAHVHVWTPDTKKYPLSSKFKVADMQPPSFTPEELFAHCKPVGVKRIVLIQMSFYEFDNRYMLDMMAAHPGVFSGVGIVDHQASDVAVKVRELRKAGVRGLRVYSESVAKPSKAMDNLWKIAADENISICNLINPADIGAVDKLCERFPSTKVVIDHFARIGVSGTIESEPLAALCRLARFPTVHLKTSAFYALGKKAAPYEDLAPMIRQVRDAFGAERLMWASDCPYQVQGSHAYEPAIALVRDKLDFLTAAEKQSILRGTAEKVFFNS